MPICSGAQSTGLVTAQWNRWGQMALPKACMVRLSIWMRMAPLLQRRGRRDVELDRWYRTRRRFGSGGLVGRAHWATGLVSVARG
jgi:hypothetical protein